jgi:hypothetical protein
MDKKLELRALLKSQITKENQMANIYMLNLVDNQGNAN